MLSDLLLEVLEESRRLGFLGPGPVSEHITSANRFLAALEPHKPTAVVDLGSGGGVPALPLAIALGTTRFVLVESMERRTRFLRSAIDRLGLGDRVSVVHERAEVAARQIELRASFDAAVARSFGPPAVTAECAAPFLRIGGALVVSEPPDRPNRWNSEVQLRELGLHLQADPPDGVVVLIQEALCPSRFPRRTGIPAKRPLF